MNHLRKIWLRLLIAFLGGGAINEFIFIAMEKRQQQVGNYSLFYILLLFILLTAIVKFQDWRMYQKFRKEDQEDID